LLSRGPAAASWSDGLGWWPSFSCGTSLPDSVTSPRNSAQCKCELDTIEWVQIRVLNRTALCPFSPPFNRPDESRPQPLTAISVDMGCIGSHQHPLSQSTIDRTCQPHQDGCYRVRRIGFGGGSDAPKCSGAVSGSGVDVKSRPHSAHGPASTSYASVGVS
jgi:hypothetical protein